MNHRDAKEIVAAKSPLIHRREDYQNFLVVPTEFTHNKRLMGITHWFNGETANQSWSMQELDAFRLATKEECAKFPSYKGSVEQPTASAINTESSEKEPPTFENELQVELNNYKVTSDYGRGLRNGFERGARWAIGKKA